MNILTPSNVFLLFFIFSEHIDETGKNQELLKRMQKILHLWNPTEIKEKEMGQDKPDPPLRTFIFAAVVTSISVSAGKN